ncbi:MAG: site-specific integrase [Lachnospiraceae bacterium]|nr:site-specific integrase [Lachnospiraceae bacterium]
MTGSLCIKKLQSGNAYYYANLRYKDPRNGMWKLKMVSTGLPIKDNKRRAEAMLNDLVEKYRCLEALPVTISTQINPDVRICEYLDTWMESKRGSIKQTTFENYAMYAGHLKRYFSHGNPRMIDVTPKMIDDYVRYALHFGKSDPKTGEKRPLAVRTVRSHKGILRGMFDQALIDGLVRINPVQSIVVHGKKNRQYSEEMLFLTEEEVAELLFFLSEHYPHLVGIAFMGAYYGLRRSEIVGLKWSAIDFEKKFIQISHTVVRAISVIESDSTKTLAGRRDLNLFPMAEKCLEKIRREQEENRLFYGDSYLNSQGYVFTWGDGRMYDPGYVSKAFSKATKAFGRPEITLHKLRHTCASMLINRGWDVKRLQYWLGHVDVQTTLNIYAHFNKHRLNLNDNDLSEISMAADGLFAE